MPLPRSGSRRLAKWLAKYDPGTISARFTQVKDEAVDRAQEGLVTFTVIETEVGKILDEYGIAGNLRIPYLNFGRKLMKASFRFKGEALVKEANAMKQYWIIKYGANPEILDKIIALILGSVPSY